MNSQFDFPRRLTLADLDRAVQVQAQAFFTDPLWQYLFRDNHERSKVLAKFARILFSVGIRNQQAYGTSTPLEGIALWKLPDQKTQVAALLGTLTMLPSLLFSSFAVRGVSAFGIFSRFDEMQKKYASEPHYYLSTISVAPEAQGKGLASKLIKPFLHQADLEKVGIYTETMTPANVNLYEHYGFRCMEQYRVPRTDLSIWSFYRTVTNK
jgi:ribosomal protein S18 acetylase RimI-like enzyme